MQIKYVTALSLILIMLDGCAPVSSVKTSFCEIYVPVYTSPRDTAKTRDAADQNNAVWLEKCQ